MAGVAEDFDVHDHDAGKGLGVKRVQTSVAPTAAGHVRVNADTWQWWASSAAAVRTAVDVEGAQTVSGAKTYSGVTTFQNRTLWTTSGTGQAGSVYKDAAGGLVVWGVTGSTNDATLLNNAGAAVFVVPAATQNLSLAGDFIMTGAPARIDTLSGAFIGMRLGAATDVTVSNYNVASDTNGDLLLNALTGRTISLRVANGADSMTIAAAGLCFINDNANANMTAGLTVNQGAADNEILSLKSSDVAHGMTADGTETDTYGRFLKVVGGNGGLAVHGLTTLTTGLQLQGYSTTDDTSHSTTGIGAVVVYTGLKSGTGITNHGANANVFVVRANSVSKFIVDAEGDLFVDGSATITAFDGEDDIALVRAFDREVVGRGVIASEFDRFVTQHRADLERVGVVAPDGADGGRGLINVTALQRLHNGALWQLFTRLLRAEQRLGAVETRLALQEG